jgi:flagellar biosynthesis component FlhA
MALESAGGSIIAMLAELMVEPVGRLFRYMFCFNNFVEEFKERKENLALALDGLQKEVEAAERNAEEIKKDVKKWLEDANNEIEGEKPLENEIGKNATIQVKQGTGQEVGDFHKTWRNKVYKSGRRTSSSAHRISNIKGIHALKIVRRSFGTDYGSSQR